MPQWQNRSATSSNCSVLRKTPGCSEEPVATLARQSIYLRITGKMPGSVDQFAAKTWQKEAPGMVFEKALVALHIRDSPPKYPQVMAIIINIIMM